MTKLKASTSSSKLSCLSTFNTTSEKWLTTLKVIKNLIVVNEPNDFDISAFNSNKRELKNLQHSCSESILLVVTDSIDFKESLKLLLTTEFSWVKKIKIINPKQLETYSGVPDYIIYHLDNQLTVPLLGSKNTLVSLCGDDSFPTEYSGVTYMKFQASENELIFNNPIFYCRVALVACFSNQKCDLIIPKNIAANKADLDGPILIYSEDYIFFNNLFYISLFSKNNIHQTTRVSNNGSRMKGIFHPLTTRELVYKLMPMDEYLEHKQSILNLMYSKIQSSQDAQVKI